MIEDNSVYISIIRKRREKETTMRKFIEDLKDIYKMDYVGDMSDEINVLKNDVAEEMRRTGDPVYDFMSYVIWSISTKLNFSEFTSDVQYHEVKSSIEILTRIAEVALMKDNNPTMIVAKNINCNDMKDLFNDLAILYKSCIEYRSLIPASLSRDGIAVFGGIFKDKFYSELIKTYLENGRILL